MKRNLLSLSILVLTVSLFYGCKKDEDTTAPEITILGNNPYKLAVGSTFNESNDPGATASDDQDGDVTDDIDIDYSELNLNVAGEYDVHYEVSDKAGNNADEHRLMYVTHTGGQFVGTTWGNYTETAPSAGSTLDNPSLISGDSYAFAFDGLYGIGVDTKVTMEADRLTIPNQDLFHLTPASAFTVSGSGKISVITGGVRKISITYTIVDNSSSTPSTVTKTFTAEQQ